MNLELFSCSGGMAEGFRRAGVEFDLVFDASKDACASYEANLGVAPIRMDVRDLLRLARAGAFRPRLELLVADPPCTPWSLSGDRKGLEDERDMLRETCDLIELLEPEAYFIGNVPGLEAEPNIAAVQATIGRLADAGYCVRDFAVLDAANYGVPQHRRRPFWFGHRSGPCLRWPEPTHGDPRVPGLPGFELKPWVTCAEALHGLSPEDLGRPVRVTVHAKHHRPSKRDRPGRTITTNPLTDGALIAIDEIQAHAGTGFPHSDPDRPAGTLTTRQGRGAPVLQFSPGHEPGRVDRPAKTILASDGEGAKRSIRWPWDRPATAVTTRDALAAPGHHGNGEQFGPNAVVLSERAAAILQGFPDGWRFVGRFKRHRWSQLGQAMPPPLAEAVARSYAEWRERTTGRVRTKIRDFSGKLVDVELKSPAELEQEYRDFSRAVDGAIG